MQLRHDPTNDSVFQPATTTVPPYVSTSSSMEKSTIDIPDEEVEYDTAIVQTGMGKFTVLVLLMMIPATWSSGFDTSALSMVLPIAGCDLDLSSLEKGWLNSAIYIGMVASAFLWGFLSDTYGRQKLLTYGYFLDAVSTVCSSMAPSFSVMFFCKFISGFMICGPYSIIMAYISEVFGTKRRDIIFLLSGVYFAVGSILQPAIGLVLIPWSFHENLFGLLDIYSWRIYLLVCALPSLLAGVLSSLCVESPKFLLDKGRSEEALAALQRMYAMNSGLPPESYPVKKLKLPESYLKRLHQESKDIKDSGKIFLGKEFVNQLKRLLTPPYLWRALFAAFTLSGSVAVLNGVRLILPEMFSHFASSPTNSSSSPELACSILMQPTHKYINCDEIVVDADVYLNMMKIYAFCFLCQVVFNVSARFIKKMFIIVFSAVVPGICAILIPHFSAEFVVYLASIYISLLNINFYCMMSVIVIMFPTSLRATSVSTSMMMARSGVLFGNLFLAGQIYTNCYFAFYLCGSVLIVVASVSLFLPGPDQSEVSQQLNEINEENGEHQ